jgi:zinc finger protein
MGDSDLETKTRIGKFYEKLEMYKNMEEPFTIIIDDPLDNSFVQNYYYPNEDKRMVYKHYFKLFIFIQNHI